MSKRLFLLILVTACVTALLSSGAMAACRVQYAANMSYDPDGWAGLTPPAPAFPLTAGAALGAGQTNAAVGGAAGFGQGQPAALTFNTPPTGTLVVNAEGVVERASDIIITDDGDAGEAAVPPTSPFCFGQGNVISVSYNYPITNPTPGSITAPATVTPHNFEAIDSNMNDAAAVTHLGITAVTFAQQTGSGPIWKIQITIQSGGTPGDLINTSTGAAIRVKNVRFDVTKANPSNGGSMPLTAFVTGHDASGTGLNLISGLDASRNPQLIGQIERTYVRGQVAGVAGLGAILLGGQCYPGVGTQSAGTAAGPGHLDCDTRFTTVEQFAGALRSKVTAPPVWEDLSTTQTVVEFNVLNLPTGVSVAWPGVLAKSWANAYVLNSEDGTSGKTCPGGAQCLVYYDTKTSSLSNGLILSVDTAGTATSGAATVGDTKDATVDVAIAAGSDWDHGTAVQLEMYIGPANDGTDANVPTASTFTGEVAPSGLTMGASTVPRYGAGRKVFGGDWFRILPVRTVLLFPYVLQANGFATGITVANTALDTDDLTTCPSGAFIDAGANCLGGHGLQTGKVTFYLFANDGNVYKTDSSQLGAGIPGLNAAGQVAPGNVMVATLQQLLTAAGAPNTFVGYVIAEAEFNYAHGISDVMAFSNGALSQSATTALVIGGADRLFFSATEQSLQ